MIFHATDFVVTCLWLLAAVGLGFLPFFVDNCGFDENAINNVFHPIDNVAPASRMVDRSVILLNKFFSLFLKLFGLRALVGSWDERKITPLNLATKPLLGICYDFDPSYARMPTTWFSFPDEVRTVRSISHTK